MMDFNISKNGYDIVEVDNYVVRLKASYDNQLQEQKDRIFDQKRQIEQLSTSGEGELMASLLKSVEKARQIEISSQNIYELETKRLQLFYAKMESVVEEITTNQDCREIKRRLTVLINEFKEVLNDNINIQKKAVSDMEYVDPVQRLLSKMSSTNIKLREYMPANVEEAVRKKLTSNAVESTAAAAMRRQVEENKVNSNSVKTFKKEEDKTEQTSLKQETKQSIDETLQQKSAEFRGDKTETTVEKSSFSSSSKVSLTETPKEILLDKTVITKVNDGPAETESQSARYDKESGETSSVSSSSVGSPLNVVTTSTTETDVTVKKNLKSEQETLKRFNSLLEDDKVSGTNFESIMFKKSDQKNKNSVIGAKLSYPTPNESGFDLKEAVNPKDDLEEIMKAFDFYDDDTKKKK